MFWKILSQLFYPALLRCTFKILGVSGSEDRDGGDNSIQFINIGRVGDKVLKNGDQNHGVEGWMTTIF